MRKQALIEGYAHAAYQAATEAWLKSLSNLNDELLRQPDVMSQLSDPGKPLSEKQKVADRLLPKDVNPLIRNLVYTLLASNDVKFLPEIVEQFQRLVVHTGRRTRAIVTSAVELSDEEKAGLVGVITDRYGDDLDFEYKVDPALIGGVLIRIGDRVIDGSVAHRLEAIRQQLARPQ